MPLPSAREVPFTAWASGVVFFLTYMNLGSPLNVLVIFAAWGVIYLIEWAIRARRPRIDDRPLGSHRDSEPAARY